MPFETPNDRSALVVASVERRTRTIGLLAIFSLQLVLLTIGLGRDYELKHEDNNALHSTFARSHLQRGLATTRGQNYFYDPKRDEGMFYAHHPPGPGLVLALVFGVTGTDGTVPTRSAAIAFHLLATWLFYCVARAVFSSRSGRGHERRHDALLATAIFAVLPESTFFGRMMNHEVLVLPAALLFTWGYWLSICRDEAANRWSTPWRVAAMIGGATWAAVAGWAGFFVLGTCGAHAAWEVWFRRNRRARLPLFLVSGAAVVFFAADLVHLTWVLDGEAAYLFEVLTSRAGADNPRDLLQWSWKILELHWRYFGVASVCAVVALGYRAARSLSNRLNQDAAVEVAAMFLVAGSAYVGVFNVLAARHDYWQFLLLPASAIGLTLVYRWIFTGRASGWSRLRWGTLLFLVTFDIGATASYTLQDRHQRTESYCQETVAELTRAWL